MSCRFGKWKNEKNAMCPRRHRGSLFYLLGGTRRPFALPRLPVERFEAAVTVLGEQLVGNI